MSKEGMRGPLWLLIVVGAVAGVACLRPHPLQANETATADPSADSMRGKQAGEVRDDNGLRMKLVWCPAGFVSMEQVELDADGARKPGAETARVNVFLTHGYWLGRYELTQGEWKRVVGTEPWKGRESTSEGDDFPVTHVSRDDALMFCGKLTELERKAGRLPDNWEYTLPTEAQWERACRARNETAFSFGDDESQLGEYAWFYDNATNAGEPFAHRVGQKKPNPWGLYDMHGNVAERCRDFCSELLPGGRDPEATKVGRFAVVRGGCWNDSAAGCRSAISDKVYESARGNCGGFRAACCRIPDGMSHKPSHDAAP
jgi:formylglycine-generating enzyme required for sulfatase activity